MNFLNAIEQRYTTKQYDNSKKIDPKQIEELKQILRLSPSSINSQPWKFTFVSSDEMKKKLSEISWVNKEKVLNCDQVVVFSRIDDVNLFEKQLEGISEGAVNYFKEFLKPLPEQELKAWFGRQLYLSLGLFLSACAAMGIDSTPMEGIEPDNYDKALGLTQYHTEVAVCIGYRDSEDFNQPAKKPKSRIAIEKVIETV